MPETRQLTLDIIEHDVCDATSQILRIDRSTVSPASRLIQDLHCDSLELVELIMELEDRFDVTIPNSDQTPICKEIFTRKHFRLSDLAEIIYVQQDTGKPDRSVWRGMRPIPQAQTEIPFSQLSGQWDEKRDLPLFDSLTNDEPFEHFRRRSDGMRCIKIPSARVEIGTDSPMFDRDSRPQHKVQLEAFLIDAEPVSTTAYCRFLNSIGEVDHEILLDWFVLAETDDRIEHVLIEQTESGWHSISGCEKWPMILVSWYGANAYSLWANREDWRNYRNGAISFLPTEAQWEYAARGIDFQFYPWGDQPPTTDLIRYGQHTLSETYAVTSLPLSPVNEKLGMSPFGLHHMAGNVWQWCRDWYDDQFYSRTESSERNAFCRTETGVRSERGGSWVGPAELCRCSHRRARPPEAKGRCLGFRCVSDVR